jgi:hypothetical protein
MFSHSYCFFTGSGPDKVPENSDLILRSHSASSIEGFLSTIVVIHLRSGAAHIVQVHRLRRLRRIDVCRRRLRMTRFSVVGRLRPQDHRCAVFPPHLRHPFYSDYSPSLPLFSSPRIAFTVSDENWLHDAATNNDWSNVFSSCMYSQAPRISARRSILDDLATIIGLSTCAFASPLFLFFLFFLLIYN